MIIKFNNEVPGTLGARRLGCVVRRGGGVIVAYGHCLPGMEQ